jgi:hypothetical protein
LIPAGGDLLPPPALRFRAREDPAVSDVEE